MTAPSDVADRLDRLASHAPAGGGDPEALWARGRRRQRARWATGAAAAVVLAISGTLLVTPALQLAQPVASDQEGDVLPAVIREPGGWAPAFRDAPGRLSAVALGSRSGLWSSRTAWWGVSATTGASRWIDLPDASSVSEAQPELSSDGRLLAYWTTGEVDADPVGAGAIEGEDPVVGIAVMDLDTGLVRRWGVDSAHGLYVNGLAWAGDVLWWSAGPTQIEGDGAFSARLQSRTWDLADDVRREVPDGDGSASLALQDAGDAPDGFVVTAGRLRLHQVRGDGSPTTMRFRLPSAISTRAGVVQPSISPDGSHLVALQSPDVTRYDGAPMSVVVGATGSDPVVLDRVGGSEAGSVLGWRGPSEAVVAAPADLDGDGTTDTTQVSTVDVNTPASSRLLDIEGNIPAFAADAWAGDVVEAPDPPFAPDPRLVGGGGAVVIAFVVSLWRDLRRRRARP